MALKSARLHEDFLRLIHPGGQAARVLDPTGRVLLDMPDDGQGGRPEVRRGELRQLLLDALPAGTVRWGHKLASVAPVASVAPLGQGRHLVDHCLGDGAPQSLVDFFNQMQPTG